MSLFQLTVSQWGGGEDQRLTVFAAKILHLKGVRFLFIPFLINIWMLFKIYSYLNKLQQSESKIEIKRKFV